MSLNSGSRLGAYEITGRVGSGGMGDVYRARDTRIGRDVAVKMLPDDVAGDGERLRRFEQEARAAGTLNHPNLVTIHEFGTHDGAPYLVMELLDGETLREKLGDGSHARIPIRKGLDYAQQLAAGLAAAHEKGIVHRDLKPENIFITRDGRLKILDFGLARLDAVAGGDTNVQTQARNTTPGTVLGTIGYMSPEQVRGLETDHRTDIFAFGAILYEMLSGRRAFRGATPADTMSAILNDDPPEMSSSTHHVSPSVDRIIRRCLEKEKSERFESARDLGFALDAVTSSGISHEQIAAAEPARARRIGIAPALAAMIVVAAAAAFVGYRAAKRTAPAAAPVFAQLTFDAGVESSPAISPDGKTFVFVRGTAPRREMFLQRVDGRSAIALSKSPDHDDRDPAFSPDGSRIAFRSGRDGGGIFVMGATGESVRRLTSSGFSPAWSPDGKTLVFASEELTLPTSRNSVSSLSVVDLATGATRRLYDGDAMQPAFSPDGGRIAFWGIPHDGGGQRDLFTIASNGDPKSLVAVTSDAALDWNPVWAPDGNSIVFASDRSGTMNLWRIAVDAKSGTPRGQPQPLSVPATTAVQISLSRDGNHLLYVVPTRTQSLTLATFDPERERLSIREEPVLSGSMLVRTNEPSPDGQWIAFSTEARHEDIFVMRADGSELRQLTSDPHRDRGVSWSADGKRIAFYSTRSGTYEAWSIQPDGSGLTQLTKTPGVNFPAFSPDGRRLVFFDLTKAHIVDLSSLPSSKAEPLPPLPDGGSPFIAAAWSPDGTRLAGRRWSGPTDVYVYSLAEKKYATFAAPTPTGRGEVEWIDGRHLLFPGGDGVLYVIDTDTGKTRRAGEFNAATFRASRNGRHAVLGGRSAEADVWLMSTGEEAATR